MTRDRIKPRDVFNICHEVYAAAREIVDNRLPTTQLETSGKFVWRPDLRPRLVEYVSDFALAGQRALGRSHSGKKEEKRHPGARPRRGALAPSNKSASRMILFQVHFLGGAEYEAARLLLGISELTWADWAEEIRERVGRELLRSRVFPPSRYFKAPSSRGEVKQRTN